MARLRTPIATLLFSVCFLAPLAAQSPLEAEPVAPEAELRQGTLPNGLQYAVLPHSSPRGDLSLRLVVNAGSLDERDDERGFAHFVEHMAFNGTRNFPAGTIRYFFQKLGLNFGPDINASTSYNQTIYMLDLPEGRSGHLDEAFTVLRDYADGVLFEPEQVKQEAGVVLSELRARDNRTQRISTDTLEAIYAGTPIPQRAPIGLAEQVEAATPEQLRAFYRRNYTPQRMLVVVVGAVEPEAIAEKISAAFGSLSPAPEATSPAQIPQPPPLPSVRPSVVAVPDFRASLTNFLAIGTRPPDTLAGHREELVQRIATSILSLRLRQRREANPTKFGEAVASYDVAPFGSLVHHHIRISSTASEWPDAVELAETELRRARESGFTQAEVDEGVASQINSFRNRSASFAGQPASRVAADLVRILSSGRTWQSNARSLAEVTAALKGLTAAEVTAVLPAMFPADALHLLLVVPPTHAIKPEKLLAAYHKSESRPIRARAAGETALEFRYTDFGRPGDITKRTRIEDLDLTLVTFGNDVRLNIRPSKFDPERFQLRVVFPQNLSHVPVDRGGLADLAGHVLMQSNLRRHKQTEVSRLLNLRGINPQFTVNLGTPILTIGGPAAELSFALQFLAAVLSDLQLDQEHYRVALSRYGGQFQGMLLNPGPFALREAIHLYAGKDSRVLLNPPELFASDNSMTAVEKWLREHILNGPLEIGIVGDVEPDAVVDAVAATVGTLKRRRPAAKGGAPLTLAQKATRSEGTAELPASASVSCVLWPVSLPDDPRTNAALGLAVDVFRDRLILALRELLGATYSPGARVHRDLVQRDFAFAAITSTFEPARAQQLTEGCVRLGARFAERGITPVEFDRVLEPARSRHASELRSNGWWLNAVVAVAQSRPQAIEEARMHGQLIDQITLEDVNRAAQIFKADRVTAMIVRPAAPKTGEGPPTSDAKRGKK